MNSHEKYEVIIGIFVIIALIALIILAVSIPFALVGWILFVFANMFVNETIEYGYWACVGAGFLFVLIATTFKKV